MHGEKINRGLRGQQTPVADGRRRFRAQSLEVWTERSILNSGLQITTPAITAADSRNGQSASSPDGAIERATAVAPSSDSVAPVAQGDSLLEARDPTAALKGRKSAIGQSWVALARSLDWRLRGFSVNLASRRPNRLPDRFMVSLRGFGQQFNVRPTEEEVLGFIEENACELGKRGRYLGGWSDGQSFWLDVSVVVHGRERALAFARVNSEEAIYDLWNRGSVSTEKGSHSSSRPRRHAHDLSPGQLHYDASGENWCPIPV